MAAATTNFTKLTAFADEHDANFEIARLHDGEWIRWQVAVGWDVDDAPRRVVVYREEKLEDALQKVADDVGV